MSPLRVSGAYDRREDDSGRGEGKTTDERMETKNSSSY